MDRLLERVLVKDTLPHIRLGSKRLERAWLGDILLRVLRPVSQIVLERHIEISGSSEDDSRETGRDNEGVA